MIFQNFGFNRLKVNAAAAEPADPTLKVWLDAGDASSYPGTGTTWYDLTSNGNNLTIYGSPTYDATTGSFNFTGGSSTYASNTTPTDLSIGTNDCSVEIWLRYLGPNDSNYYAQFELGQMVDTGGAPYNQGGITAFFSNFNDNALQHQIGGQSLSYMIPTYPTSSPTWTKTSAYNVWVQTIFVKSGNTGEVYINGSSIGTNTGLVSSLTNTNKIFVGSNNPSNPFGGQIPFYGDVAIFKAWNGKALTSTEVTDAWDATKARFGY